MKKTISLILCLSTILSSVAFSLPAVAADIDFGVESSTDYATPEQTVTENTALSDDTVYAEFPMTWDFEDTEIDALPEGMLDPTPSTVTYAVAEDDNGNKVLDVNFKKKTGKKAGRIGFSLGNVMLGSYRLTFDIVFADGEEHTVSAYYKHDGETTAVESGSMTIDGSGEASFVLSPEANTTGFICQIGVERKSLNAADLEFTIDNVNIVSVPTEGTIVFDANGGTGTQPSQKVLSGSTFTLPTKEESVVTREYYDFVGWARTADGRAVDSFLVERKDMVGANLEVTVYAVWQRRTFSVTVNYDGGVTEAPVAHTANEGETCTFTLPTAASLKKSGYLLSHFEDASGNVYDKGAVVSFTEAADLVAKYIDLSEMEIVTPTKVSGYDGKTTDVDPRYPGAFYTFDTALDASAISADLLNISGDFTVAYDEDTMTLAIYPNPKNVKPGASFSIAGAQTALPTADGKGLVKLPEFSYKLASYYPNEYENMIPYGDNEGDYFGYFTTNAESVVTRMEDEDGNHFARLSPVKDKEAWPHTLVNVLFESGETYKVITKARSVSGGSMNMNISFTGTLDYTSNPDLGQHANGFNHMLSLGSPKDWMTVEVEFTPNISGTNQHEISVYSNPSGGKITTYDVDDFALYKKLTATFGAGVQAELKEGETAPATLGYYPGLDEESIITLPEMPYESTDEDWQIDTAEPWIDQNGNTYAAGATVDLAETGKLTLTPNMVTDKQTYTVKFVGKEATNLPADVKVIAGKTLDLSKLEDIGSTVAYKRFNGWSLTGDTFEDALALESKLITVDKDMTLTAVITPGYNFAIKSNNDAWRDGNAKITEKCYDDKYMIVTSTTEDAYIFAFPSALPAAKYKALKVTFDMNYGDGSYYSAGKYIEGFFFGYNSNQGDSAERNKGGSLGEPDENGLVSATFDMYTHAKWVDTIGKLRFDLFTGKLSVAVRSIEVLEADVFENTEIALTGLTAPACGTVAETNASAVTDKSGIATVKSLTWSPSLVNGRFDEKTVYTATVTLAPNVGTGKMFAEGTTVTMNGVEATTVSLDADTSVITATFTYDATEAFVPFTMEIVGSDELTIADRSVQYKVNFNSEGTVPDKSVTWSISDTEVATMSESGRLTPHQNTDKLIITATSNYNPFYAVTKEVKLSNQADRGVIVYNPGTTDTVEGLPADTVAYGPTTLSSATPTREGYSFIGWATSDETISTVASVNVPAATEVNVYAVWGKGVIRNYNDSGNGYTQVDTHAADYRYHITNINIDPREYSTVLVRMSSTGKFSTRIYYKSQYTDEKGFTQRIGYDEIPGATGPTSSYAQAETYALSMSGNPSGLDDFITIVHDFSTHQSGQPGGWPNADKIVSIYVDPCRVANQSFRIASVMLLGPATVTFDPNTTDTVTGMPGETSVKMGGTLNISDQPTREGYTFVGWSKSATDRSDVKTSFGIAGDVTLYAVWDKAVDTAESEDGVVNVGEVTVANSAILVKGTSGVSYELSYIDASGIEGTVKATANAKGYAVIDLTGVSRPISGAVLTSSNGEAPSSVVLTDLASAEKTANYVKQPTAGGSSTSTGSVGTKYKYDTTVVEVKNDGEQYVISGGSSDTKTVLNESKSEDTILFNFDEEYEADFFKNNRQMTLNSMKDSVISFKSLGKKDGSGDSPALFTSTLAIDAVSHKYIVVKAKHTGLTNGELRVYFQTSKTGKFSEGDAMTQKMTDEYSMLVYDMSSMENWKDTVTQMFFSLGGDVKGTVDIDWIMFTNTVPASMDEVEGNKELFPVVNKGEMPFTDVAESEWYHSEISNAYKLGFVEGESATIFNPNGDVTIAEAITLAVRVNYIYNGKEVPTAATEGDWFTPFVNAAIKAGIIKNNQFTDYDVPALRKQVAAIMVKALPSEFYTKINMFTEVPDLAKKDSAYSAVLKLYNAGIVAGVDGAYNFLPENNITRAEVAAIINRLVDSNNRKRIVTEAEIESRKKKIYADDLVAGANLGNCEAKTFSIKNGAAWAKGTSANDPIVYFKDCLGDINGKEISKITVGVKDFGGAYSPVIYFTTPSGGWAEARKLVGAKGETNSEGVTDYVFDCKANAEFANTITAIRFDPFNAAAEFGLAYIIVE